MVDFEALCGTSNRLKVLLRSGNVVRYHTEGPMFNQLVSEHTWRVMIILMYFWPWTSKKLLLAALFHDAAEGVVGDVSKVIKKRVPQIDSLLGGLENDVLEVLGVKTDNLSEDEKWKLKFADILEVVLYIRGLPISEVSNVILGRANQYLDSCINDMKGDLGEDFKSKLHDLIG
jgi:5'-deoxynucleotidase YfbR-like